MKRLILPALIALALAALAAINLARAGDGVARQTVDAGGVPLELFRPQSAPAAPGPAVLVAHGFSGNRQLMYAFGHTLAKNGYTAALIDFAGHGASRDRMPDGFADDQYDKLASNIDASLGWLRAQPFVDAERVAILGHSMGASAVARYGSTHPEVPLTIALSLGNFGRQLPPDPALPRNMLILVGAAEFGGFIQGSTGGLLAAYPDGVAGRTYGDFADGTARRLVLVPGVEHISILFSHEAFREIVRWLDQAFAFGAPDRALAFDDRIGWVLLLYVAAAIGFYPLAAVLLGPTRTPVASTAATIPAGWALGLSALAAAVAPLALRLGVAPFQWMPLTVGNYVGMYFLIYGLIVGGIYAGVRYRRGALRLSPVGVVARPAGDALRPLLAALALAAYALLTFGLVAHLTWNNFALIGERAWIAAVLFAFCLVFFLADEYAVARPARGRRLALYALTKVIVIASLLIAVAALGAPGFLLLLLPVLVVLFLWHGLYSHWLYGLAGRPWIGALVNAAVFAWTIAATFAVVRY